MHLPHDLVRAGENLLVATAHAVAVRERVDAITRDVLAAREYVIDPALVARHSHMKGGRVLEPSRTYLIESSVREGELYPEIARRSAATGLRPEKPGCCPALEAEWVQREAEVVFLEALGVFLGKERDAFKGAYGDKRKRAIELGLTLIAPSVGSAADVLARLGVQQAA